MEDANIIKQHFYCPRCQTLLLEKRPQKDKHLIRNKTLTVRLYCPCGYYRDEVVEEKDFLQSS